MKKTLATAASLLGAAIQAHAEGYGKPCTSEPKEKWLAMEQIEKIVRDHGYQVAKSKLKDACY